MNTFVRRSTVKEIEIEGNSFSVDYGRDEIGAVVRKLEADTLAAQEKYKNVSDVVEREGLVIREQKRLFREAIDFFLGDGASAKIFCENDNQVFYSDVYLFIIKGHADTISKNSPLVPNRAQRRRK